MQAYILQMYVNTYGYSYVLYTRICTCIYICEIILVLYTVIPNIYQDISDKTTNETQSVKFTCEVTGKPVPNVSWYFNSVMVNVSGNSTKYMIMSRLLNITTTENTLTVYNVTSSDVGTYDCSATNVLGNDSNSGLLQVNG